MFKGIVHHLGSERIYQSAETTFEWDILRSIETFPEFLVNFLTVKLKSDMEAIDVYVRC